MEEATKNEKPLTVNGPTLEEITNVTTTDEFDELLEKAEQILHQLNSIKPSKELSLL